MAAWIVGNRQYDQMTTSAAAARTHVHLRDLQRLDPRGTGDPRAELPLGIRAAVDISKRPFEDTRFLSDESINMVLGTLRRSTSRESLKSAVHAIRQRLDSRRWPAGVPAMRQCCEALGAEVTAVTA